MPKGKLRHFVVLCIPCWVVTLTTWPIKPWILNAIMYVQVEAWMLPVEGIRQILKNIQLKDTKSFLCYQCNFYFVILIIVDCRINVLWTFLVRRTIACWSSVLLQKRPRLNHEDTFIIGRKVKHRMCHRRICMLVLFWSIGWVDSD